MGDVQRRASEDACGEDARCEGFVPSSRTSQKAHLRSELAEYFEFTQLREED